jgi:hypothetical protein
MPLHIPRFFLALGLSLWVTQALAAQIRREVDLELVLAVDVSFSMSREEQSLQRSGYVGAIRDPAVVAAIQAGPLGRIAVTFVEWGGVARQIVPWTLIDGQDAAERFAAQLDRQPISRLPFTSISRVLAFGRTLLRTSEFAGRRQVIDVSGDGPNNTEVPVALARDRAVEEGVVVNGLPIMLHGEHPSDRAYPTDLDTYYRDCVIGGGGAFMLTISSRDDFQSTILAKLLTEILNRPVSADFLTPRKSPIVKAAAKSSFDCLAYEMDCRDGC